MSRIVNQEIVHLKLIGHCMLIILQFNKMRKYIWMKTKASFLFLLPTETMSIGKRIICAKDTVGQPPYKDLK